MKVKQSLEVPYEGDELTRAARQEIDDNISQLKSKIQSLRMKRNELAPISALPPEVLSNIFVLVRDLFIHGPFTGSQDSKNLAPWIHVGHICHRWREIALNCPSLWSIPVLARPNLAREMIQRSKMAPLTIRSPKGIWSPKTLGQLENILAQIPRIQSMELVLAFHPQRIERIFSLLSQPTPLLQNLSLSGPDSHITFPSDALLNAPRLRSISFRNLKISWESAIFKHRALTDLRLTNSFSGLSTMGQMMDTLHHLPHLRILTLIHSVPPSAASDGNSRTIDFKSLEQLELHAKAADCVFLLRHIQYPSSTTVKLHSFSTSVENGMTTVSLLGQNTCRVQSTEDGVHHSPFVIRSARLTSDLNMVEIAFFNRVDSINNLYGTGGLDPIVRICLVGGSGYFTQAHGRLLTTVVTSFNLSSLEGLLLDWNFTSNHIRAIRDSLGKLLKLKVIKISESIPEICIALAGANRDEKPKNKPTDDPLQSQETSQYSPPVVLFPALETLMVQAVDFRQRLLPDPGFIDCLVDMLIKRSSVDAPIDNLSLEECRGVRTWQIRLLGELVVHLEVDSEVIDVRELEPNNGWSDENDFSDEDEEDENEYSDNFYYRDLRL